MTIDDAAASAAQALAAIHKGDLDRAEELLREIMRAGMSGDAPMTAAQVHALRVRLTTASIHAKNQEAYERYERLTGRKAP